MRIWTYPAAAVLIAACGRAEPVPDPSELVWRDLEVLASDSLAGRRAGEAGARAAAVYVAAEFSAAGVEPAGDSGFFQRVPFERTANGRLRLVDSWEAFDALPESVRVVDWNVVGRIPGSDPDLTGTVVVVGAHHDHVGIGRPVDGDSIYNGADDDATGVAALLRVARELAPDPPARTVLLVSTTAEEMGLLGTRWYVEHPTVPLERVVAELQVEMIGRPDTAAGGPGRVWLTGYERSTMGELLEAAGVPVVPDPRVEQGFFRRSDNYVFALAGVPAHTISSFGLHGDYHRPSDELDLIDREHLTTVLDHVVGAVRTLATGPAPEWIGDPPTP